MIRAACQQSLIQKYKGLNSAGNLLNVLNVWISTQTSDCVTRAIFFSTDLC